MEAEVSKAGGVAPPSLTRHAGRGVVDREGQGATDRQTGGGRLRGYLGAEEPLDIRSMCIIAHRAFIAQGRCRLCRADIEPRAPISEAPAQRAYVCVVGLVFVQVEVPRAHGERPQYATRRPERRVQYAALSCDLSPER